MNTLEDSSEIIEFSMTQIENWYFEMIKSKDFEMF